MCWNTCTKKAPDWHSQNRSTNMWNVRPQTTNLTELDSRLPTFAKWSNRPNSSLRIRTRFSAEQWEERFVKPTMSANKILKKKFCKFKQKLKLNETNNCDKGNITERAQPRDLIAAFTRKWATTWLKPIKMSACPAKTQISLGIHPAWSESSLYAQWLAKGPRFLHASSEDRDQTGRMPRLIWVFAGHTHTSYLPWAMDWNLWDKANFKGRFDKILWDFYKNHFGAPQK